MWPTCIICNRTGGQGKTLICHLTHLGYREAGINLRLAAADTVGSAASKLGKFFPGQVKELGIGLSLEEIRADGPAAVTYWDQLGKMLLAGGAIIDLGANIAPTVWDWARTRDAGRILRQRNAPPIVLVVPVRPQAQALEDAVALLNRSIELSDALPIASRILVLNELGGRFDGYGTNEDVEQINLLKERHGLLVARMRACKSELWPAIERQYLPFDEILSMTPEEIESRFGLDPFAASGAQMDLVRWVNETLGSFRSVGLIPPPLSRATKSAAE
ncbi:MAG: hypothetical protein PSX37_12710 [bacterium]|nr:hypothetical protein [bacterium]